MGNLVRGLTLSVSGFLGMALCLNYSSSSESPYLVPVGLASVLVGVVGFILMISGINQETKPSSSNERTASTDKDLDLSDHPRMGDGVEKSRLDDPTAKY